MVHLAMSGMVQTDKAHDGAPGQAHASLQLPAWCLAASLVLHAAVFFVLPDWHRPAPELSIPVLDVVMVSQQPEVVRIPQAEPQTQTQTQTKTQTPRRTAPRPQPVLREAVGESAFTPAAEPEQKSEPRVAVAAQPPSAQSRPVQQQPEAKATPPLFNAAYLRNPAPVYPAIARRSGDQGTVMLKVLVNPEGAPVRVELDQSSGSGPLDSAALDAVRNWRFVPARRGDRNIEDWVRVPIVFRLEGAS